MPLSSSEQRLLEQIEAALRAEDPDFASIIRSGAMRAPSIRRRIQGGALFLTGLAMLVAGIAFTATMIAGFPVISVLGFVVMFGGALHATTGWRLVMPSVEDR